MHNGKIRIYCYAISLDIDCVGGQKKNFELALQFWDVEMSQYSGAAGSANHELNIRYDGIEATAFCGNYSDCSDDEKKWVSESAKIQDILRRLLEDCGVEARKEEESPAKTQKKPAVKDYNGEPLEDFPDIVDAQCMEVLVAILGPRGQKVLKQDRFERRWTMMNIIQKGRVYNKDAEEIKSFLRSTPAAPEYEIEVRGSDSELDSD